MNKYFFRPRKGENYSQGFNGLKTLVVGAYHFCWEAHAGSYGCTYYDRCVREGRSREFDDLCPIYKSRMDLYDGYYRISNSNIIEIDSYTEGERCPSYGEFTHFMTGIRGRIISQNERLDFWNSVAFYNYIQHFLPEAEDFSYQERKSVLDADFPAFMQVLEELEPDVIYIWTDAMSDVASPSLVIVNMASFPESRSEKIKSIMMEGVPVIFIRIGKDNIDDLNRLLPHKLNLEDRKASSFLITKNIMETAGLSHADFYFSEFLDRGETAMNAGMSGLLIDQSEIIVRACRTDWQRWNYRPETSKTGNVYRSELEKKGSDVAVVHYVGDGMDIILSTLDFSEITTETQSLVIRLLNNSGVRTHKADLSAVAALDENLQLHRCMAYGPFDPDVPVKPYDVLSGNNGKICTGNRNASIRYNPDARNNRKTYFLSFRVFSPRSLKDLLIEPDMPSLDMYVSRQGNIEFFLNGIAVDRFETVSDNEVRYPDVLLEKGWNDILLKIEKGNDVRLRFESSDEKLKSGIMSGITD